MNHSDFVEQFLKGVGVEIGAFDSPIPGISPIYVDKFNQFAGKKCLADYPGEASRLPFYDCALDYVVNSHVIEHLANPVSALVEWERVLKPGGYVYMVVPDRRFTFDRNRALTSPEHMIEDYLTGKDDTDDTHIEDFVFGIDWDEIQPGLLGEEAHKHKCANAQHHKNECLAGNEINIHFHVFEPSNFVALIDLCVLDPKISFSMRMVKVVERFPESVPNGFLVILQKDMHSPNGESRLLDDQLYEHNHLIDQKRLGEFEFSK